MAQTEYFTVTMLEELEAAAVTFELYMEQF